jgi:hypothetical protein
VGHDEVSLRREVSAAAGLPGAPAAEAGAQRVIGVPRRENSRAARVALLAFILSPLAVLAVLCVLIWLSLKSGPMMHEPPRGAGGGATGMHNQHLGGGR